MSQQKVDRYKEEKKNRNKIMRREKFRTRLAVTLSVVALAALVGWFGWAVYNNHKENAEAAAGAQTTSLDLTMMESYQTQLSDYADRVKNGEVSVDGSDESVASTSAAASSEDVAAASTESTSAAG